MTPTTFVNIASLDDHRTVDTVACLYHTAAHPIRVVVVLQTDDPEHAKRIHQVAPEVRIVEVPLAYARGPVWARALGASYWNGEDFYYQCDAHTQHPVGWDATLAGWSDALPEKHILSHYIGFRPPGEEVLSYIDAILWDHEGLHTTRREWDAKEAVSPIPARFIGAGHLWAPGRVLRDCPQDPFLFFQGEEQTWAARLWTHGYDLYHPPGITAWSSFTHDCHRLHHYHGDSSLVLDRLSKDRVQSLFGHPSGTVATCYPYGFGAERSIKEWYEWSGCDPRTERVTDDVGWRAQNPARRVEWASSPATVQRDAETDVFATIASFDDPDTPTTAASLLSDPGASVRLHIVLQTDNDDLDRQCRDAGAEVLRVPLEDAPVGVGWPRAVGQALHRGERWWCQADAHMRFPAGWAAASIDHLLNNTHDRTVLSGRLGMHGGCVVDCAWMFARALWLEEMPYDPRWYYHGEDPALTLRSWTNGWDVIRPQAAMAPEHIDHPAPLKTEQPWQQRGSSDADIRSREQVERVLRGAIGPYGLGVVRALDDFENTTKHKIDTETLRLLPI